MASKKTKKASGSKAVNKTKSRSTPTAGKTAGRAGSTPSKKKASNKQAAKKSSDSEAKATSSKAGSKAKAPAAKDAAPKKKAGGKPAPGSKASAKAGGSGEKKAGTQGTKGETKSGSAAKRDEPILSQPTTPKATIRRPEGAEELKAKLGALTNATNQIRTLKRSLSKNFYAIGHILQQIRDEQLYEVKGYGSFESFADRELDLGKQQSLKIARIPQVFQEDAALAAGLDRVIAALDALEGEEGGSGQGRTAGGTGASGRSPIPIHKQ